MMPKDILARKAVPTHPTASPLEKRPLIMPRWRKRFLKPPRRTFAPASHSAAAVLKAKSCSDACQTSLMAKPAHEEWHSIARRTSAAIRPAASLRKRVACHDLSACVGAGGLNAQGVGPVLRAEYDCDGAFAVGNADRRLDSGGERMNFLLDLRKGTFQVVPFLYLSGDVGRAHPGQDAPPDSFCLVSRGLRGGALVVVDSRGDVEVVQVEDVFVLGDHTDGISDADSSVGWGPLLLGAGSAGRGKSVSR